MATCPECGTSSRTDPTAMTLEPVLWIVPETVSLAGVQMKAAARTAVRLACRCGWSVTGQMKDGYLVPLPITEG